MDELEQSPPTKRSAVLLYKLLTILGSAPFGAVAGVFLFSSFRAFTEFDKPPEGYIRKGAQNPAGGTVGAIFGLALLFIAFGLAFALIVRPLQKRLLAHGKLNKHDPLMGAGCLGTILGALVGMVLTGMFWK